MALGKFIAIEGLDGAGTSTQIELLKNYLRRNNYRVFATKEPTDNMIGGLIRGQLRYHWKASPGCLQLLFAADRSNHLSTEIIPALKKGAIVLSDRYVFSSLAFGGVELDMDWLKEVNSKFPKPDLTVFIDTSPGECIKRLKNSRLSFELFEQKKKLEKVRINYLKLIKGSSCVKVDGNKSIADVFGEIKTSVEKIL